MRRQDAWMQYAEAEERTQMGPDELKKLVHDGNIRKKPWYLPPFGVDLLRTVDIEECEKDSTRKD